jgi:hypothetical protein
MLLSTLCRAMIDACEKGAVEVTRTLKTLSATSKRQDLIKGRNAGTSPLDGEYLYLPKGLKLRHKGLMK